MAEAVPFRKQEVAALPRFAFQVEPASMAKAR